MAQFSIRLPDNVLLPDTIASVRAFAARTNWGGLPSSTHLHAAVIGVVLRPPDTDTSMAEEGLLLLAAQRMVLYLESPNRSKAADVQLWLSWIGRIETLTATYQHGDSDATRLFKDKLQLSIELMQKATDLLQGDKALSEVLHASASELSESAEIQTRNESDERIRSALAVADIAKQYSFDEHSIPPPRSIWEKIKSGFLGVGQ